MCFLTQLPRSPARRTESSITPSGGNAPPTTFQRAPNLVSGSEVCVSEVPPNENSVFEMLSQRKSCFLSAYQNLSGKGLSTQQHSRQIRRHRLGVLLAFASVCHPRAYWSGAGLFGVRVRKEGAASVTVGNPRISTVLGRLPHVDYNKQDRKQRVERTLPHAGCGPRRPASQTPFPRLFKFLPFVTLQP